MVWRGAGEPALRPGWAMHAAKWRGNCRYTHAPMASAGSVVWQAAFCVLHMTSPTDFPTASSPIAHAAARWPRLAAPQAPREDHWIEQLGRRRNDDFAWLKYIPETGTRSMDNLPEPLGSLLQAERQYAQQMLAPLAAPAQRFRGLAACRPA